MRHCNKVLFAVKKIECDVNFKSIMDEVSDDMEIKTNYENPYEHAPESESNNRVIKERFRIAYYLLTYKNISSIMIHHFVINATQNLNMLPSKGGVVVRYSPNMILSQSN